MPRHQTASRSKTERAFTLPSQRNATVTAMQPTTIPLARLLDLEADAELQHGHVARAEMLATRAAELRGWA